VGPTWVIRLNPDGGRADDAQVRVDRLVLEAAGRSVALDLHPRLTVVTGVGSAEREGLVSEFVGALGSRRSGVHLEVTWDDGTPLAVFRPEGGDHRVVNVTQGMDVSDIFQSAKGGIDLLQGTGLDTSQARRLLRCTAADLQTSSHHDEVIRRLAGIDQQVLWHYAEVCEATHRGLRTAAEIAGSEPEDAVAAEAIEERHAVLLSAQDDHDRVRRLSFFVATFSALGAAPLSMLEGSVMAMPFVLFASVAAITSIIFWNRVRRASNAESEALEAAGVPTYLGFHLDRVNSLLANDRARRVLLEAADVHRAARSDWEQLVGNSVTTEWATEHKDEILAAARLRQDVASSSAIGATGGGDLIARFAQALDTRLAAVRNVGLRHMTLPLILDDTFQGIDSALKPPLLELLSRATVSQQVLFLTNDPDVANWARAEAIAGNLALIEPVATASSTGTLQPETVDLR
jgi:hypothetical protein